MAPILCAYSYAGKPTLFPGDIQHASNGRTGQRGNGAKSVAQWGEEAVRGGDAEYAGFFGK